MTSRLRAALGVHRPRRRSGRVLADAGSESGVFGHGYTYSSHPLAAAVAMTNLDLIEEEGLVAQAASRAALHARAASRRLRRPSARRRGRGHALIGALEFVADRSPREAFDPREGSARGSRAAASSSA
jgi:L-2,4-diaminobutyrate transaminase